MATAAAGLGVATKGLQAAGKSLMKGAQGAHGAGMALSAASSLASAQGAGGPGGIRGAMAHVGRTTANLGKSAVQNLGGPMSGRSALSARSANGGQGNLGSRMADSMAAKKAELTKPQAPSGGDSSKGAGVGSGDTSVTSKAAGTGGAGATGTGSVGGAGTNAGGPSGSETERGRAKRDEFRDALRHFGNRVKSHNAGDPA
jgi:hypothetical protein